MSKYCCLKGCKHKVKVTLKRLVSIGVSNRSVFIFKKKTDCGDPISGGVNPLLSNRTKDMGYCLCVLFAVCNVAANASTFKYIKQMGYTGWIRV